ncbi:MAG: tetratricopeptide repeat protein, partial [Gammaproteobacteria bacterium]|nr:tetratricopeptide repeat protein [Gammaproteobacteria bacterium]
ARSGLALLKSVGLEALVARDAADYVRIATGLARDTDRLDRLRREIPARFDASPLRDEAAFTRDLETAWRDMWRRWCQPPSPRRDEIQALLKEGNEHLARGGLEAAADRFDAALALQPDTPETLIVLGTAFYRMGRLDASATAFEKALALKPDSAEACHNLGTVYMDQGRLDLAAGNFQKAIGLKPDAAVTHYNLGLIRFRQGNIDEAIACNQRALALRPDLYKALNNLGVALAYQGRNREAMHCYEQAVALQPGYANPLSSRLCAMNRIAGMPTEEIHAAHRDFAARCEAPLKSLWRAHANTRDPERRLRIGYVSADFRRHSVASFIEPVLARHDHGRFEVFCYYNHTERDAVTDRLVTLADRWLECPRLTDDQLAERIRMDGIDILIDLGGHTDGHRLLTFARKPAPVQVTYLGYPATTGLTAMDYRLCTLDTDPPGQEAWHSETLYRLPRTLWCYRPPGARPACGPAPVVQSGRVTFGSMNTYPKITAETFSVWMELLLAVPDARLIMTAVPEGSVRRTLAGRIAAHGIAPERVSVHSRISDPAYHELMRQIDIALDPFPYTGTTTTCETLWMGIPVVTLAGETSVARSGLALLTSVGLEELVARDSADYVRIATGLARDTERLDRLRREIPARFDASPLRDEAAFTRDLEAAWRDMWRRWCQSEQGSAA